MHNLVSLKDVSVRLGGKSILRGVTANIPAHKITTLVGLNGSGKTTLLRTLLGEVSYQGLVRFHCGHDHSRPAPEHIGYVPQKLRIEANMPITVRDLFALALQRRPIFFGISRKLSNQMAEMLKLVRAPADIIDRPMDKLSGGEQQRVLLALALHPNPELLLLDEPAAGIDFQDQEKFYDLIAELNRTRGATVLVVSHDLTVMGRHAHHAVCLREGLVARQGPASEILTSDRLHEIFGSPWE